MKPIKINKDKIYYRIGTKKMDRKITELSEKFIVYYALDNSVDIYTTLETNRTTKLTMDEFMKYNPPCKECLVQSMCINGQDHIEHIIINGGITIKSCEKLKSFIEGNQPLFNRVKLTNI